MMKIRVENVSCYFTTLIFYKVRIMKKVQRELRIKAYHMTSVEFSETTAIKDNTLSLSKSVDYDDSFFEDVSINIIRPGEHDVKINTIMDIVPISTKVLGRLGEGITHTLTGAYVMITGADTDGVQMHEFGSSEGILSEQLVLNRAGSPGSDDFIIHVDMILKPNQSYTRELATTMFKVSDDYIQPIREKLKLLNGREADEVHVYEDKVREGKPKVAIVKQIAGQGAMYDNLLFPDEPSGLAGGLSIIDLNNMPVLLSPNEYRDGAIRAMV